MRKITKLRWAFFILFMLLLIAAGYLQFCRKAEVVSTFKTSFDNSCSYIIDVSANKLYLSNTEADQIFQEVFDRYSNEKCHMITIYIYRDRYAMKKGIPLAERIYNNDDSMRFENQ